MNKQLYYWDVPVTIRVAQAVGITATAFLAGQTASTSYLFTPAILEAPAPLLARQWKKIWTKARATAPALSISLSVLFGWLAYKEPSTSTSSFKCYLTSSILLPSIIPYTILLMGPLNAKLVAKAESMGKTSITDTAAEVGVTQDETVHALVDKWATLNLFRAIITGIAAMSATWGSVRAVEVIGF